jgi:ABC-type phosphate transport system substrate-binding protein
LPARTGFTRRINHVEDDQAARSRQWCWGRAGWRAAAVRIQGAGATFPNPIYQRWVSEYQKQHPDVQIDYQSIGSGGGIKGITQRPSTSPAPTPR